MDSILQSVDAVDSVLQSVGVVDNVPVRYQSYQPAVVDTGSVSTTSRGYWTAYYNQSGVVDSILQTIGDSGVVDSVP